MKYVAILNVNLKKGHLSVYLFLYLISKYFVYIRYKNRYIHTYIDGLDRQIDRESLLHAGLMNTDIYN